MNRQLDRCVQALRIAFGLTETHAGLDKFFNVLADWSAYVSPAANAFGLASGPSRNRRPVGAPEVV
jgi:hypothetical protein